MDTIFGLGDRIKTQRIDILSQMAVIFDCTTDYLLGLDNRRFVCTDKLTKRQEEALTNLIESMVLPGTKY